MSTVDVVVGGQYGSEGKGAVAAALVANRHAHNGEPPASVRVGGPNAGHTAYDPWGRRWALRQVPVGAVVHERAPLVIAAGSEVDPLVLEDGISQLHEAGIMVRNRLVVDEQATVILDAHKQDEAALTGKIGSTAKGIGAARAARMMRQAPLVADVPLPVETGPTGGHIRNMAVTRGVVIEGTQGYGLGLHAGHYPYCTSGDVTAVDTLALAGVSPWMLGIEVEPWVVLRAYPIRVAGNSGPMLNERSWDELGLEPEQTTVTKKTRRVGEWDPELAVRAIEANGGPGAVRLALTMADHICPEIAGAQTVRSLQGTDAASWVLEVEDQLENPVEYVGTGPTTHVWRR